MMALNFNSVLKTFIKYYSSEYTNKKINSTLLSVINSSYARLDDGDFAYEQMNAKRNLRASEFVKVANTLTMDQAKNNASAKISKFFNNVKANEKIKYVITKIIDEDESLVNNNYLLLNGKPIQELKELDFPEFIICLIVYVAAYTKCRINKPIEDSALQQYEEIGKNECPYIFLDDENLYLTKYDNYYKKASKNVGQIKTILYRNQSINLYKIFIAPDVISSTMMEGEEKALKLTGGETTPKKFTETFGHYTSINAQAGAGKSIFMKHLFCCDSLPKMKDENKSRLIPIYIEVRQFIKEDYTLEEMLYNSVAQYISIRKEQFTSDFKRGGFLLLFDGIDEIKASQAESFFNELNSLTIKYDKNYYVTASRPLEQNECLTKFRCLTLCHLSLEKSCRMINKLPDIDTNKKNSFIGMLQSGEYNRNQSIASNPLLLTLMFIIYIKKGKIPSKTYLFYAQAYNVLYDEHDMIKGRTNKKFATGLKKIKMSEMIAEFCYKSYSLQNYDFTDSDIIKTLNSLSLENKVEADDFINDLRDNLGLLYSKDGKYVFIHRSFQEYFAAYYLNNLSDDQFKNQAQWFENLGAIPNTPLRLLLYIDTKGSGVFHLLREMNPNQLKNLIVIPYLKELLGKEKNDDKYILFLTKSFEAIEYGHQTCMTTSLHLLKIILGEYTYEEYIYLNDYNAPEYEEYIDRKYYMIDVDENNVAHGLIDQYELEDTLDEKTYDEQQEWLILNKININEPDIMTYSIPTKDLIEKKDALKEFIEYIKKEDCPLKKVYNDLWKMI